MLPSFNSYSILYTLFTWFLGMCYGFVLLSSAAGQNGDVKLFENGESLTYQFESGVLLNDKDSGSKNVGFSIAGEVTVKVVWGNSAERLLKIELISPQLNIKSRKAPTPDGFVPHSSKLDNLQNKPFLIVWNKGRIEKILLAKGEALSLSNLKKGIASLLQFQILDGTSTETDASGQCTATYTTLSPTKILKTKTDCISQDFPYIKNPDKILGTEVHSTRETEYEFDTSSSYLKSIKTKESHEMYLAAKEEIGNYIESTQVLEFVKSEPTKTINGEDVDTVIEKISQSEKVVYTQESLLIEREPVSPDDVISFSKQVNSFRDHLKPENVGTLKPAKAFILLVNTGRNAKKEELVKVLDSNKNKKILSQLYDLLGYIQTQDSHEAAMKKLHFDNEDQIDLSERYLWSLSFSSHPNTDVIDDLLKKYRNLISIPEKVKETLILTIASMTQKLTKINKSGHVKLVQEVEQLIINNLEYAKDTGRYVFFRALKNLQSETSIPILLQYIKNGTQKEGVLSFKAIKSFPPKSWNTDVLKVAEKSFYQLDRKYDSSSRTIAADILLESNPNDGLLRELLNFLLSKDPAYEIKQYLFQRIKMIADSDPTFRERVESIIKTTKQINNYSGLAPRGLSTALSRSFMRGDSSNGSLVSVQEMKTGIVKRGTVNIVLEKDGMDKELFSLGIFCGGLNSFISSDGEAEEEEPESTTAGMELTVLGTQIRPFVFFEGQGELMGHVWSGTASEKTSAFQALALLHDHLEYLRLGSGFVAELNLKGATSFDLSGKIEISLWNRNAESLVQKSAGIVVIGSTKVDSAFVKSQIEFTASIEPKLNLQTDIDFSSNVHLCMRLTQPDSIYKHNIFKIERIPGSKHKLRIAKYKKSTVPGRTYFINKKNNQMCNAVFS